ncbi:sigma-70 family RNA polymerase sigma factor [Catellatospora sp. KI3]|uniref:RNA polymerase sigma factor n=1 Tax=Catellatospora sp. KI3 TaxID=3041620 RepID=UPI002482B110|nr:sigma-70 family RNA polymerase sigma factor [Catellatospora sp. KI3]MDI1459911.1 sigma-70 family RNA polymerase sigma factor [Catellatospora sp. KI3]
MTTAYDPALDRLDPHTDHHLIALVRGGDTGAYGLLYRRHYDSARRLARVLSTDTAETDDLIAETFAKVLAALREGGGPDSAFRAYLLTTMRHTRYDRARRERRLELTDDLTRYETAQPTDDPTISRLETSYAARAFARLPERWRAVLWHTEVEGESPAQVAPIMGLTPNGVAALAYRARERLRQMYLQEHIATTGNPRCHWTGSHLAGYVRAALARRDRAKVDEHLTGCAECRRLHRELAEENGGLRGVLAPVLLGAAAAGYLSGAARPARIPMRGRLAAWLHDRRTALRTEVAAALTALAAAWWWLAGLPRRLVARFGAGGVVAGAGVALAALAGVLVFALMTATPVPVRRPQAIPVPAPAGPASPGGAPTAAPAPTAASSATARSQAPRPSPARTAPPGAPEPVAPAPAVPPAQADPAAADLTAGGKGTLPIPVRAPGPPERTTSQTAPAPDTVTPEAAGPDAVGPDTVADTLAPGTGTPVAKARGPVPAVPVGLAADAVRLEVTLPAGVHLIGADGGDGWRCETTTGGAACAHAALRPGQLSTVRLPVEVDKTVSGFQPVATSVEFGGRRRAAAFRVPVAPAGMRAGYAASGRVDVALAGNTLLSCSPRPQCFQSDDNNLLPMLPLLPGVAEPQAPDGLFDKGGPKGPDGRISVLAGPKAAAGARLILPRGAEVRWAGLVLATSSDRFPQTVGLHGPSGRWHPVEVRYGHGQTSPSLTQGFADVTGLVRTGGDWWLAAPADELPHGSGQYAGWSLAVVYARDGAPRAEAAVYLGPRTGHGDDDATVALGPGGQVKIGLALWDGDLNMAGDSLYIGDSQVGVAGNLAGGRNSSAAALACRADPGRCTWRTPGVDVLWLGAPAAPGSTARLRTGRDPLEVGLLAVVTEAAQTGDHGAADR